MVDALINMYTQEGPLTDVSCVKGYFLRSGRTVLVLSLDPNMELTMAGKVLTVDDATLTGSSAHMAVSRSMRQNETED